MKLGLRKQARTKMKTDFLESSEPLWTPYPPTTLHSLIPPPLKKGEEISVLYLENEYINLKINNYKVQFKCDCS